MDLSMTDFSFFGSYMSLAYESDDSGRNRWLCLKSLHGVSKARMKSMKIVPVYKGKPEILREVSASWVSMSLRSEHGSMEITFSEPDRLLFRGTGKDYGLMIDTMPVYNFEYNYLLGTRNRPFCIVNSYKNLCRYLIYAAEGGLSLEQQIQIDTTGSCDISDNHSVIMVSSNSDGEFLAVIEDIPTHSLLPVQEQPDFTGILKENKEKFADFANRFPKPAEPYKDMAEFAAYVLWSATVAPQGNLTCPAVYASTNMFPGVWSWDQCFMAIALNKGHHRLAFQQMEVIFRHQDSFGQLPGSVSDSTIRWNFCKPPVHGYIFSRMIQDANFTADELRQVYKWIGRQTDYYLKYKDSDGGGICEYWHGNDSGEDNSTVFARQLPIESPDLTAYLIKSAELLQNLAERLGDSEGEMIWKEKSEQLMEKFLDAFIEDGIPIAREAFSKKTVHSGSLMPFQSLILGKRLPDDVRSKMLAVLKDDFLTEWGLATEAPESPLYQEDSYWRGAIWAPATLLFYEALMDCGEELFARNIAERFCTMVSRYGFFENFSAKTGKGLRDKPFSWTAAVFLYFAARLAERN